MKKLTFSGAALLTLLVFAACGEEPRSRSNDDDDGGGGGGGALTATTGHGGAGGSTAGPGVGGSTSMPGGPTIESLTASSDLLAPSSSVTFTAVVSDPDGTADIAQGVLTDGKGLVYATFLKSGGGNNYLVELSWHTFSELDSAEYPNGGIDVVFQVVFEDIAGHSATANREIGVSCDGWGYCGGDCADTSADMNHCGGCGIGCPSVCQSGACGSCQPLAEPILFEGCDAVCATKGKICSNEACGGNGVVGHLFSGGSCGGPPLGVLGHCADPIYDLAATHVICCCV